MLHHQNKKGRGNRREQNRFYLAWFCFDLRYIRKHIPKQRTVGDNNPHSLKQAIVPAKLLLAMDWQPVE
jgi:hypothetical protein